MTDERSLNRVLDQWLATGSNELPDRVIDAVADQIERVGQRPQWRLRRRPFMNTYAKLAAGLAAVLIVGVVGWQLLPGMGGIGVQQTPAPTLVPTPTSPADTFVPVRPEGSIPPGTYQLMPLGRDRPLRINATVPAGWQGLDSWAILGQDGPGAPAGIGIASIVADGMYSDPCHWDVAGTTIWPPPGDITVGPTVDDLVNALVANHAYTSTAPTDITLGGFHGKRLTLQLPADISGCDQPNIDTEGRYEVFSGADGGLYAQGPSNRFQLSILDVAGLRLIVVITDYSATS